MKLFGKKLDVTLSIIVLILVTNSCQPTQPPILPDWNEWRVDVIGPGSVTMQRDDFFPITCREDIPVCTGAEEPVRLRVDVNFTATPDAGRRFVGWRGDVTGNENPLVLTVEGRDYFFEAVFE
jgi:hypothetical protein